MTLLVKVEALLIVSNLMTSMCTPHEPTYPMADRKEIQYSRPANDIPHELLLQLSKNDAR